MRLRLIAILCSIGLLIGCGGDASRGVNRDRDRPRSASEKDKAEKAEKK